jgi:2-polyprenyl-3-methyl-5-hydroxy-6-metoxy-1,4-benzoquinol methylase
MKIKYVHNVKTHNPVSATIILPFVFDIVKPKSVLDIGCGNGSWLTVCKDLGVSEIFGVDGIQVERSELMIEESEFLKYDLTKKLELNKKYDMAISLEVAEHLPESAADTFVESLTSHTSTILFSAAIPQQGGQYHLNEQWPNYWNKKFKKRGFQAFDILRLKFWDNEDVLWWYRQNMVFFVKQGEKTFSKFEHSKEILSLIHPSLYQKRVINSHSSNSKKGVLKSIFKGFKKLLNR